MSRRVDRLITHIRNITENQTLNSSTDISDEEIIEYLNEAQHRLQSKIVAVHPNIFIKETTISTVADQEEYNLPSDVFLAGKIVAVDYKTSSSENNYFPLKSGFNNYRQSHVSGIPNYYIRRDKLNTNTSSILLSPRPASSSETIRVTYVQRLDELDKRRGIVSAVTLDSGTSTITSLTLDVSGDPPIDNDNLGTHDYFTVVDSLGNIKMRNVQFDSINTTTGVVTVNSSFTYESGESISVGDYIVGGQDTTSHSRLPRNLERYLINYAKLKIFLQDSSTDSQSASQELALMEQDIIESYSEMQEEAVEVQVTDDWEY